MRSLRVLGVALLSFGFLASVACSKKPSVPGAETPDHPIFSETDWELVDKQTGDVIGRPANKEKPEVVVETYFQKDRLYIKKEWTIFYHKVFRDLAAYNKETRMPEHVWLQVQKDGHWYTFELGEKEGLHTCDSTAESDLETNEVSVVTICKDFAGKEVFRNAVKPKS